LAGRTQQNGTCGQADDTSSDGGAQIVIVFVSIMISVMVSVALMVPAAVVAPAVARPGFCGCKGRQKKGTCQGGGNETFAHGLHRFSPKAGAVSKWRRI
jgi:hypothetical protein